MLTLEEKEILGALRQQLAAKRRPNKRVLGFYEGTVRVKNLDIAVPRMLSQIGVVSDWPSTVVDTHHERMHFEGWADNERFGMTELSDRLAVSPKVSESILDSGIFGVGFDSMEHDGERWQLRSVSPLDGTLLWDYMSGRPYAGYRRGQTVEGEVVEVLSLPGRNLVLKSEVGSDKVGVAAEYPTIPGEVVFHRARNGLRSRHWYGRSMITPPVMYYTEAAARTLLGMEINREFYTTPQRWALNADITMFTDSEEPTQEQKTAAGWRATAGNILMMPPPEDGEPEVKVGQFSPASPEPYVAQLRTYSQLVASASGIPSSYLGFSTDNPPSGDAIRAWMDRLIRKAEGQQRLMSPDLRRLGWHIAVLAGEQSVDWGTFSRSVSEQWTNPATQQLGADADALGKLGAMGWPLNSPVTFDLLGLSAEQRRQLQKDFRSQGLDKLRQVLEAKQGDPNAVSAEAEELASKQGSEQ